MLPFRDINPTRSFPLVTITLIVTNCLVFAYMLYVRQQGGDQALDSLIQRVAVVPAAFVGRYSGEQIAPVWLTVFTAMFMHGGIIHLLGNMLYLWIFGNNIEDIMGSGRFLLFYLLCGVIATAAHIAMGPGSTIPALGASGAIAGVLGAYLVRFPRAQVDSCLFLFIFVTVVRLPAILVLGFWFVMQLFNGMASLSNTTDGGGVAFWAHIGGFLAGMVLVNLFSKRPVARYNGW